MWRGRASTCVHTSVDFRAMGCPVGRLLKNGDLPNQWTSESRGCGTACGGEGWRLFASVCHRWTGGLAVGASGWCVRVRVFPGGLLSALRSWELWAETPVCLCTCGSHVCLLNRDLKNLNTRERNLADVKKLTAQEEECEPLVGQRPWVQLCLLFLPAGVLTALPTSAQAHLGTGQCIQREWGAGRVRMRSWDKESG